MNDFAAPMPRLSVVEAALKKTTELLAHELAVPTDTAPAWSEFEWRIAQAVAVVQGTAALLSNRLRWCGPGHWQRFLAGQKHQTCLRQRRILALLDRIDERARTAGIALVALKGTALCRLGLYPAGDRPMGDIDLWSDAAHIARAARLLQDLGYARGPVTNRHLVFEPPWTPAPNAFGEHVDHPIKIELHTRISEYLPVAETDITAAVVPRGAAPGVNAYPSNGALMQHLLLHAAGNLRARALRFSQLHDIALLAARMDSTDWRALAAAAPDARGPWWALAPLALTQRYYAGAIPPAAIAATARHAPWLLRGCVRRHRLVDVSWSRLRIQAFPGIEWSRSPAEAFAFMSRRVFPSRRALAEMSIVLNDPCARSVPWYGLSHSSRILRWVFSRPPRVQMIYPVRIALGLETPA